MRPDDSTQCTPGDPRTIESQKTAAKDGQGNLRPRLWNGFVESSYLDGLDPPRFRADSLRRFSDEFAVNAFERISI